MVTKTIIGNFSRTNDEVLDTTNPNYSQGRLVTGSSAPDVIVADTNPATTVLIDQQQITVELDHSANTVTDPTFQLGSTASKDIVKEDNDPLDFGDTGGVGYSLILKYSSALDKWVLLNPIGKDELYANRAAAVAGSDIVGAFVQTAVFSSTLGNGGAPYEIVSIDPLFPDINPQRPDGNWLKLVHEGELYLSQAGVGLNTGDESVIINAVFLDTEFTKYILPRNLRITNPLRFRDQTEVTSDASGFAGNSSTISCIGTTAVIFDATTQHVTGLTLEGVVFDGDDTSDFIENTSPDFGDFRFSIVRDNNILGFIDADMVVGGTDLLRNNFDQCESYTISGGDSSILRNFFNTRTLGTAGTYAVTFAANNSTYDGNFITAGTNATQTDNPNGLQLGACNRSRILNTWVDLGGAIGVLVGTLANSTIISGTQVKMGSVAGSLCMQLSNVEDVVVSDNTFNGSVDGIQLSGTTSNVKITDNLYTDITGDNITQNGAAPFDITIDEISFESYPISKATGSQSDYLRGVSLTNEGATGSETFNLPASGQLVGDTFFFTRVAAFDLVVATIFAITSTGPQSLKVTWDGSAWIRMFLDTTPPTTTTSLASGELWNNAGTPAIV